MCLCVNNTLAKTELYILLSHIVQMIEVRFMPYDHIACFYTSTVFPGMVCTKSKYEMQVCVSSAALHYLILVCTIIYSGISWTVDPRCGGVLVFGFSRILNVERKQKSVGHGVRRYKRRAYLAVWHL